MLVFGLPVFVKNCIAIYLIVRNGADSMIKDLTEGNPRKILWQFTMPMFISVIFQQLYNIADSIIVGKFAANGENALAAVGASYPITMIFMAIAMGCNVGCAVVISQLFGAKRHGEMKTAVSTTLLAILQPYSPSRHREMEGIF